MVIIAQVWEKKRGCGTCLNDGFESMDEGASGN